MSTKVSSRHLSIQIQLILIVKNELVATKGYVAVSSVFGANTLQVAQQSSNFSNLNTEEVSVSVLDLLIGIVNGVLPEEQVYRTIGLVLQKVVQF